jgi:hypothetical protein
MSLYKYVCTKHVQKSVLEMLEWKTTAIKEMECWPEHLKFKGVVESEHTISYTCTHNWKVVGGMRPTGHHRSAQSETTPSAS